MFSPRNSKRFFAATLLWILSMQAIPCHAVNPIRGAAEQVGPQPVGPQARAIDRQSSLDRPSAAQGDFPALIVDRETAPAETLSDESGVIAPIVTTVSSLMIVLAVFGVLVLLSRRYGAARATVGGVPDDVVQHLGSTALDAKTRVSFLRIGQRLLVIGQTQNGDPQTLSEITETEEVERLTHRLLGRPEIVGKRASFTSRADLPRSEYLAG